MLEELKKTQAQLRRPVTVEEMVAITDHSYEECESALDSLVENGEAQFHSFGKKLT